MYHCCWWRISARRRVWSLPRRFCSWPSTRADRPVGWGRQAVHRCRYCSDRSMLRRTISCPRIADWSLWFAPGISHRFAVAVSWKCTLGRMPLTVWFPRTAHRLSCWSSRAGPCALIPKVPHCLLSGHVEATGPPPNSMTQSRRTAERRFPVHRCTEKNKKLVSHNIIILLLRSIADEHYKSH